MNIVSVPATHHTSSASIPDLCSPPQPKTSPSPSSPIGPQPEGAPPQAKVSSLTIPAGSPPPKKMLIPSSRTNSHNEHHSQNSQNSSEPLRKRDLRVQFCVNEMEKKFVACASECETQGCAGESCGAVLRCGWGLSGLVPKVLGGIVSCVGSACCGCCALLSSPGCLCGRESCLGACSLACCSVACESLRVAGMSATSIAAEICCGVPSYCCSRVCHSKKMTKAENACYRAAGRVLMPNINNYMHTLRPEKQQDSLILSMKDSLAMSMVREAAGSHLFKEKIIRAHHKTRSELALAVNMKAPQIVIQATQ